MANAQVEREKPKDHLDKTISETLAPLSETVELTDITQRALLTRIRTLHEVQILLRKISNTVYEVLHEGLKRITKLPPYNHISPYSLLTLQAVEAPSSSFADWAMTITDIQDPHVETELTIICFHDIMLLAEGIAIAVTLSHTALRRIPDYSREDSEQSGSGLEDRQVWVHMQSTHDLARRCHEHLSAVKSQLKEHTAAAATEEARIPTVLLEEYAASNIIKRNEILHSLWEGAFTLEPENVDQSSFVRKMSIVRALCRKPFCDTLAVVNLDLAKALTKLDRTMRMQDTHTTEEQSK